MLLLGELWRSLHLGKLLGKWSFGKIPQSTVQTKLFLVYTFLNFSRISIILRVLQSFSVLCPSFRYSSATFRHFSATFRYFSATFRYFSATFRYFSVFRHTIKTVHFLNIDCWNIWQYLTVWPPDNYVPVITHALTNRPWVRKKSCDL